MSFPPYPSYRDSGIDWLGHVPSHWRSTCVKRAIQFGTGWTPPTGRDDLYGGSNTWVTISDLSERMVLESSKQVTDEAIENAGISLSPRGSLLFSFKLSIGQVAFAGCDLYTNEAIATFIPSTDIDLAFAYYAFPVFLVKNAAENIYGAKLLNRERIREAKLVLPPRPEQAAIAAFLDRETAKIDALVEVQRRLIELIEERRRAVISHAVTKGLNADAPVKKSGVEWLGDAPMHWEIRRIAVLFREVVEAAGDDFPILSVSIHAGVSDDEIPEHEMERTVARSEDRSKYKAVQPNDLVYNMMRAWQGGFGTVKVIGCVSPAYVVARPIGDLNTQFIEWLLRTPMLIEEMRRRSVGVADFRLRLYWGEFKDIEVPVPPLSEQNEIVNAVQTEITRFDALSAEANQAIDVLGERRAALIAAAVTGQIDVRRATSRQAEAA